MGCKAGKQMPVEPAAKTDPSCVCPVITAASAAEKALTQLKAIFDGVTVNEDGSVSKADLTSALEKDTNVGGLVKESGLNTGFADLVSLVTSKDGCITWDEFHLHVMGPTTAEEVKVVTPELSADEKALAQLKKIFESVDANDDGSVSKEELAASLGKDETLISLVAEAKFNPKYGTFEQLDTNKDGRIAWSEFEAHLRAAAVEAVKEEEKAAGEGDTTTAVVLDRDQAEGAHEPKSKWCC